VKLKVLFICICFITYSLSCIGPRLKQGLSTREAINLADPFFKGERRIFVGLEHVIEQMMMIEVCNVKWLIANWRGLEILHRVGKKVRTPLLFGSNFVKC